VRIPIVFLTGRASDDEERRARSAGAVEFLRKPVGTATLLHVLQKLFQARSLFAEKAMTTESRPSDESKARGNHGHDA
jgi:CheY-like chemotaxis protein